MSQEFLPTSEITKTKPTRYVVFKMIKSTGEVIYTGAIPNTDPQFNEKIIEADNYFTEQAEKFGFEYDQSERVGSLASLGVPLEDIVMWDTIKQGIVQSDMPPLHKLLSEVANQGVSAEVLDDLKRDLDFNANQEIFLQYLDLYFPNDLKIRRAYDIALEQHSGDPGKGFREVPYSNHPIQMANIAIGKLGIRDSKILQAILLHDVVEDTEVSFDDLSSGFDTEVMAILRDVTKGEGETRDDYMQRVANPKNPKSKLVKCIDRFHNLLRSFSMTSETYNNPKKTFKQYLEGYIRETEYIYREAFETKNELAPIALKFSRYLEEIQKRVTKS